LELAYNKALRVLGINEAQTSRVSVPQEPVKVPKVETQEAVDMSKRRPAPQKSIEDDIGDSIVEAARNNPLKRFFGV